jgi:OOP family OmpA-OmpF porin
MKKSLLAVTASTVWLCALSPQPVLAQDNPTDAFLYDTGKSVVKNSYDECWQTSEFPPEELPVECGGKVAEAPPPPEPVFEKITLETDTLFDFDKATLRPQGKEELSDIIAKMKEHPEVELIRVTAYADPIGTESYNENLSQRRADSVKGYMAEQGVEPQRIETVGRGETNEFAQCEGVRGRSTLIKCYQPNRRAEVEIVVQRSTAQATQ